MGLALYSSRVRSNEVLGGTESLHHFPIGKVMSNPHCDAGSTGAIRHLHKHAILYTGQAAFNHL
jgi:hypothetical protein